MRPPKHRLAFPAAHWGSGATLLLLALLQPSRYGAVAMLTVAVTLESCIFAGFYVSHMDLSPNYGGALMGLSNGCGSVMGILAPLIVGLILKDDTSEQVGAWRPRVCSSWWHLEHLSRICPPHRACALPCRK